ncbi:MAG: pyruvate dehydrogenase (acetyl-transferring) E1 component subunit alpha [Alphaproteobacteria bacterium]
MGAKTSKKQSTKLKTVSNSEPSAEELKKLYRDMLLMRRFEEKAGQLYGMGLIGGFCHLYIGQEAVVAGAYAAQEPQDTVITAYRNHGHILVSGIDPKEVMAELTGRAGGCSRGKGGSMHMFSIENGFYGGHGIVGAQISIGTGLGFAHKYKEDNGVCLAYMGDGAADQGQVLESYNMAALWQLPVLYIVENNQYSMGTSTKRHAAGEFYKRGEPYGIPGEQVDGMDVFAVKDAVSKALAHIRSGKGPYILEMMTYRYRGHSMSDPAKYRTKDEVSEFKDKRDPITQVKSMLLDGLASEDEIKAIDKEIKAIVNEAAEFSKTSPEPEAEELWTDILVAVDE